jgi:hypothetical protein
MDHIGTLFHNLPRPNKSRETRRGTLILGFLARLNPSRIEKGIPSYTYGRLARMLKGIPDARLEVIKGNCDEAERTGFPWSVKFHLELKKQ